MLKVIESERQQLTSYLRDVDTNLTPEEQLLLKQQLQSAQTQLEQITDTLTLSRKALEIVERKR